MNETMRHFLIYILVIAGIIYCNHAIYGQSSGIIIRGLVTANDGESLIAVTVAETDNTNRVINTTITDINGEFSMKINNPKNKLRFTYIGFKAHTVNIGDKKVFNITLTEDNILDEIIIQSKQTVNTGGFAIPERELGSAVQKISTKEFEGLSVPSIDDALQGRIAGLDIVANSGDVGSGMQMRVRGVTSINAYTEPLIVVDGVIFETPNVEGFDFATANEEKYAELLSVSPDDIESIVVLKDAASTAVWGSKGANGVLQINTKKGIRGRTTVQYSYRLTGAWQPQGMKLLSGDDYTMLMKEAYFNPKQSNAASNIDEFNYIRDWSEFNNYNKNTDWVDAVTQFGWSHDHNFSVSGGGERARYRVSINYFNQTGTVIEQKLDRYSTRMNLEYFVSDRIKFTSDFSFTYTDNDRNYDNLLSIAYKKMPNLAIYEHDADNVNTGRFYNMLQTSSDELKDQRGLRNPVASAKLAKNNMKSYRVIPIFRLQYDLLNPENQMLRYTGLISFDVQNNSTSMFLPKELSSAVWNDGNINRSEKTENRSLSTTMQHDLTWLPRFSNPDHVLTLQGSFYMGTSSSRAQTIKGYGSPSISIEGPTAGPYNDDFSTSTGKGRSMAFTAFSHYSYQGKYSLTATLRRDGSTKYGDDRKFGSFPGISARWNIIDEPFMESTYKWLSMLAIRPSWGITGNQPRYEYLHYSRYSGFSQYMDIPTMRPNGLRLSDLRWEKTMQLNAGLDLGFFDHKYTMDFNYYYKKTEDMLFLDQAMPSTSGYAKLSYQNGGTMRNIGYEYNFNADRVISAGDFNFGFSLNLSNYMNTVLKLKDQILDTYNGDFSYENGKYLSRLQLKHSFGSIYGFKYKGVYQYSDYVDGREGTSPHARDAAGNIIKDAAGNPVRMVFGFRNVNYHFQGGDAIYEDINNDGTIDELDIVYLGNSNPKINGGINLKFNYKRIYLSVFSHFRYGNKIINTARMNAENMYDNNNQAASVNWRWRKEGDVTNMPRALYKVGYNWLASDRYVEDGSFLRVKYITLSYSIPPAVIRKYYINQMSFYITVNNPFLFTKYSGADPEVNYGSLGVSTDGGQTPRAKSFTTGVTLGF